MAYKGRLLGIAAVAGAAFLLAGGPARAQYFNFTVTINNGQGEGTVSTGHLYLPGPTVSSNIYTFQPATNNSGLGAFFPGTNITVYDISAASSASTAVFLASDSPFQVNLTLTPSDSAGNPLATGITKPFTGTWLAANTFLSNSQANLAHSGWELGPAQNQVYSWTAVPGFGNETINAHPTSITPAQPPGGGGGLGAMSIFVQGNLTQVPEPGTLSLLFGSGVGGSLLFLRRLRRR